MKLSKGVFIGICILTLLLQSCASLSSMLGLVTAPNDSNSSLIYGQLDINQEKIATTRIYFTTLDMKKNMTEIMAKESESNVIEQQLLISKYNNDTPLSLIDPDTGVFAIEINEFDLYCIDKIWITDNGLQTRGSERAYIFNSPENRKDELSIQEGEIYYYGSVVLEVSDNGDGVLEPSMDSNRNTILDQVEIMLDGKGWENWIAKE